MKNQKEIWNNYISKLEPLPDLKYEWEKEFYTVILKYVNDGDKIIELGCSNARWVKLVMDNKNMIEGHGTDINASGFIFQDIIYHKSDALKTEFDTETFDLAFSLGLIEHFNNTELLQIIDEHIRIVKKKGFIIIMIPILNYFSLSNIKIKILEKLKIYKGPKHYHITSKRVADILILMNCEILFKYNIGWIFRWRNLYIPKFINNSIFFSDSVIVIAKKINYDTKN